MHRLGIVILISLLLFVSFAHSEEAYVPKNNEELYDIWINKEYDKNAVWAKWVFNPNGTWASYRNSYEEESLSGEGPYKITDKWIGDKGDVWYKMTWENKNFGSSGYGLIHITNYRSTMEGAYSSWEYPIKIDKTITDWRYGGIHYRK